MTDEDIRKACQSHNCERCTPLGKRSKRNSILNGKYDTKEDCCKMRFGETGCPRATEIKIKTERLNRDGDVRKELLSDMGLDCWARYQMNSKRCMVCSIAERCYTTRECNEERLNE